MSFNVELCSTLTKGGEHLVDADDVDGVSASATLLAAPTERGARVA